MFYITKALFCPVPEEMYLRPYNQTREGILDALTINYPSSLITGAALED